MQLNDNKNRKILTETDRQTDTNANGPTVQEVTHSSICKHFATEGFTSSPLTLS